VHSLLGESSRPCLASPRFVEICQCCHRLGRQARADAALPGQAPRGKSPCNLEGGFCQHNFAESPPGLSQSPPAPPAAPPLLRLPPEVLHLALVFAFGTHGRSGVLGRSQSYPVPPESLDIRQALVLSSVSRASRALLQANICFFTSRNAAYTYHGDGKGIRRTMEGKPGPCSLLLGFRPRLTDGRLFWFLASLTVPVALSGGVASVIRVLDLRSTGITEQSIVTIFKTLPSLQLLDVGECKGLNLIQLAGLLRGGESRGLVVRQLKRMEVCGSGDGCNIIGYRQELSWVDTSYSTPSRSYEGPRRGGEGGFRQELKGKGVLHRVGGNTRLQGAVREIEAAVHALQQPRPVFTMGVNICEDCGVSFAEFVPHDGKAEDFSGTEEKEMDFTRSYGRQVRHLQAGGLPVPRVRELPVPLLL
jgi:hypothetical protein